MNTAYTSKDNYLRELNELFGRFAKGISLRYSAASICTTPVLDKLVRIIGSEKIINIKNIAAVFMITSGAATQHVAALEKLGFVTRSISPDDRRGVLVSLTPAGESAYAKIEAHSLSVMHTIFEDFDEIELRSFIRLIRKASKNNEKQE